MADHIAAKTKKEKGSVAHKYKRWFLFGWPLLVLLLLGLRYSTLKETTSVMPIILLAVAAIPPLLFAVMGAKFIRYWKLLVGLWVVAWVLNFYVYANPAHYTSNLPTSTKSSFVGQVKSGVVTQKTVSGVNFTLIKHRGTFPTDSNKVTPNPQSFDDGILVPYQQPGSKCTDWVALKPASHEIVWSLYGTDQSCDTPEYIKWFPNDDIVAYATASQIFVKKISTGQQVFASKFITHITPLVEDGVAYFTGTKTTGKNEPVHVLAYSLNGKKTLWDISLPGSLDSPKQSHDNFFANAADNVVVETTATNSTTKHQYFVDKTTGKTQSPAKLVSLQLTLNKDSAFYIPQADIDTNIHPTKNGSLSKPITKLQINGKEVTLPEPCLSYPVIATGWVICVGKDHLLLFKPNKF